MTNTTTGATTKRLILIVLSMFGFGFALVPLYDVLCAVTGFNGKTSGQYILDEAAASEPAIDERLVTVQFLANNNGGMPWDFRPAQRALTLAPGVPHSAEFYVRNNTDKTMTAQAVPSVTPFRAAEYLHKTECFCFEQQTLAAGESLDMPLRFIVDNELPPEVTKMTLSYTLYDVTDQVDESDG